MYYNYFTLSFGKRPADELFDLEKDPDCVNNIASDPQYASLIKELKTKMEKDLFGFANAINIDHLNDEQIKTLEEIFKDFK